MNEASIARAREVFANAALYYLDCAVSHSENTTCTREDCGVLEDFMSRFEMAVQSLEVLKGAQ
jgi:hypothetical protein